MLKRDIVILSIVLAGIIWLIVENYHRTHTQQPPKPATIEHVKPVQTK